MAIKSDAVVDFQRAYLGVKITQNLYSWKLTSVVIAFLLATLLLVGFAYFSRVTAQDVPNEPIPNSHIVPVIWEASGNGDSLSPSFDLSAGVVVVRINYAGVQSGILSVRFLKTDGSDSHRVLYEFVSAEEGYSGARAFDVYAQYATLSSGEYRIEVNSEGDWDIDVSQPSRDVGVELPRFVQGTGDGGYFPFAFHAGLVSIYYEYIGPADGSGSILGISLIKMDGSERERLVYDFLTGSELPKSGIEVVTVHESSSGDISPGVYLLQVESEGDWRVALGAESFTTPTPTPIPQPTTTPTPTMTPAETTTPVPTATLTPTPVVSQDILNRVSALEKLVMDLQGLIGSLESRIAALEASASLPSATPVATPQVTATPTPVVTATPAPGVTPTPTVVTPMPTPTDDCVQTLDAGSVNDSLRSDCLSDKMPDDGNAQLGTRYARFFTFALEVPAEVTISLTSTDINDTYLYLLAGAGRNGDVLHKNDDIDTSNGNYHSRIAERLQAGSYTIEATTYDPETAGDFTLTLNIAVSQ